MTAPFFCFDMKKLSFKKIPGGIKAAFPYTIPVFLGWIFVALTYGVLMSDIGYNAWWTMLFSAVCFCGSMQIAAIPMMAAGFDPAQMLLMSYLVNFRHSFYGIPLLEKYKDAGVLKPFMIYTLSDEQFSLSVSAQKPEGVEDKYFYFGINFLCFIYWVGLCGLGGVIGGLITFDTTGLDFALTAMFVVMFLQQWKEKRNRPACVIGIGVTLLCRIFFGTSVFLIPSLLVILLIFWIGRDKL